MAAPSADAEAPLRTLPLPFAIANGCYLFNATFRGDMYHVRACQVLAQQLKSMGLTGKPLKGQASSPELSAVPMVIYNRREDAQVLATITYVTEVVEAGVPVFVCPWSYKEMTGAAVPTLDANTTLNGVTVQKDAIRLQGVPRASEGRVFGVSECTEYLHQNVDVFARTVPGNMVLTNADASEQAEVDSAIRAYFPPVQDGGNVVLVLWRNTTASGGPYPELNTGFESLKQMAKLLSDQGQKPALIDVTDQHDRDSINTAGIHCSDEPYFKAQIFAGERWLKHSKRDVEAYFIKRAYQIGCFGAAMGLRSGALDLLTFLGIPTMSIGLDGMVGESRMNSLADPRFKRINVEYFQPRHAGTGYIIDRRVKGGVLLQSPISPDDVQPAEDYPNKRFIPNATLVQQWKSQPPGKFSTFDLRMLKLGLLLSTKAVPAFPTIQYRFMGGGPKGSNIVNSYMTRYFHLLEEGKSKESLESALKGVKAAEDANFAWRKDHAAALRQTTNSFNKLKSDADKEWAKVLAAVNK